MAVTVTRAPKRRASPPREPRVRKSGFKPILRMAALRTRSIKDETLFGQTCALSALAVIMCAFTYVGVWMAREAEHKGAVALAAWTECDNPRPLSHVSACKDFACLAKINDENARYVRICHPEALRG